MKNRSETRKDKTGILECWNNGIARKLHWNAGQSASILPSFQRSSIPIIRSNICMYRFITRASVCALVAFAVGCGSTPASRFYTLSAVAPPAGASSNVSVVVGPVSVPAEVDRPQIVITTGPNQVGLDEFNRWAAPLQNNISRVVVENLVAMLGTPRVTLFPQTASPDADYRAAIEVQRFESALGEAATLDAVWTVRRAKDGKAETGRTTVRETMQGNGYDVLAAAHSRAVARLSGEIADAVRTLDRSGQ